MTELEYIHVRNLSNVKAMRALMHDIMAVDEYGIDQEAASIVSTTLRHWENSLHLLIKVKDSDPPSPGSSHAPSLP
jgi:hypothetical protein